MAETLVPKASTGAEASSSVPTSVAESSHTTWVDGVVAHLQDAPFRRMQENLRAGFQSVQQSPSAETLPNGTNS